MKCFFFSPNRIGHVNKIFFFFKLKKEKSILKEYCELQSQGPKNWIHRTLGDKCDLYLHFPSFSSKGCLIT